MRTVLSASISQSAVNKSRLTSDTQYVIRNSYALQSGPTDGYSRPSDKRVARKQQRFLESFARRSVVRAVLILALRVTQAGAVSRDVASVGVSPSLRRDATTSACSSAAARPVTSVLASTSPVSLSTTATLYGRRSTPAAANPTTIDAAQTADSRSIATSASNQGPSSHKEAVAANRTITNTIS